MSDWRVSLLSVLAAVVWLAQAGFALAERPTYIVIDHDSGQVLAADGADEMNYPASLTKMMTLYLTFDALRAGRLDLATSLQVSPYAASMPPSKLGLRSGSRIRVEDAIEALTVKSANDMAVVLAEAIGGSEARFAQQMTRVARLKGLRNTTYWNASGLPNPSQMTTARDIATLARALIDDFPQYYHYFGEPSFTYAGRTHGNHNRLLAVYRGMDGLKTGYIRAAGYNLAASAVRDGHRLVGVVLGGETSGQRNGLMTQILDDGFSRIGHGEPAMVAMQTPQAILKAKPMLASNDNTAPLAEGDADPAQFGVQVGAFASRAIASAAATRAMTLLPRLTNGVTADVDRVNFGKRVYTARLIGLSRGNADRLCDALRQRRQPCFVVKLDDDGG